MSDKYDANIAVAAVDILGMRNLVSRDDQVVTAMAVLAKFVRNASTRGIYNEKDLSTKREDMFDLDTYFGDSLYLFSRPGDSIERQVQLLTARVASLIGIGFLIAPRFMVRAAIAVGDLRTRVVQSTGSCHEVRMGSAMVRAHALQECQMWIGGAIYPGTPINAETRKWISDSVVPLKKATKLSEPPMAINWIWSNSTPDSLEQCVTAASREVGSSESSEQKLSNTLTFVRAIMKSGQRAPYWGPEAS